MSIVVTYAESAGFCAVVDEMSNSMSSVRELLASLREKQSSEDLNFREGISLLSLKPHLMLSYLSSLTLLSASRAMGASLSDRTPVSSLSSFSDTQRETRGDGAGDLVDAMVEGRVVLEKIKALEGRMRYQIEKLVRLANDAPGTVGDVIDDPLAFRPNPQALLDAESGDEEPEFDAKDGRAPKDNGDGDGGDGIYRPPKLAPVPYNESSLRKDKSKERRRPVPAALASLAHLDPSRPYAEGTSGLGAAPAANMEMATGRMKDLKRMTEFEEENFTRLIMKKKDARQRLRDEADIALGGVPTMAKAGRRRGGLEDEFADVLRSVGRSTKGATGDGYEELRQKGRKQGALERSRKRGVEEEVAEGPKIRKKSRFDREAKAMKKRTNTRRK